MRLRLTVLKYSGRLRRYFSAIFLVVTTPAIGCPFPIGLPIVTISGTTPEIIPCETVFDVSCISSEMQKFPEGKNEGFDRNIT